MKNLLVMFVVFSLGGCTNSALEYDDSLYSRLDDERNETLALKNIRTAHPNLKDAHINVHMGSARRLTLHIQLNAN